MNENTEELADLLARFLQGNLTGEESKRLESWRQANPERFAALTDADALPANLQAAAEAEASRLAVWSRIQPQLSTNLPDTFTIPTIAHKHRRGWWAAAASIVLLLGVGAYLFRQTTPSARPPGKPEVVAHLPASVNRGGNKATLTLADGSTVLLDDLVTGNITRQGNTQVLKSQPGELVYRAQGADAADQYNTLTTPKGGQFKVTLPDGTRVWLNAASSLVYPTAFNGAERMVVVSGEAYFEVAKNDKQPFLVRLPNSATIRVTGTHFNVMVYDNEDAQETTLLEGAVEVSHGESRMNLAPGQQSRLASNGSMKRNTVANLEDVVAWKNGMQAFNNDDIRTIMRRLERWYDVSIEYQGAVSPRVFSGDIPRSAGLPEVLKLLSANDIHCSLDSAGKKIIVMP